MNFVLEPDALRDLARVLDWEEARRGWSESLRLEDTFWASFALLGNTPGLGHKRPDLVDGEYFFYLQRPYFIVYRKLMAGIAVLAVVHSSRDIPRALRKRF